MTASTGLPTESPVLTLLGGALHRKEYRVPVQCDNTHYVGDHAVARPLTRRQWITSPLVGSNTPVMPSRISRVPAPSWLVSADDHAPWTVRSMCRLKVPPIRLLLPKRNRIDRLVTEFQLAYSIGAMASDASMPTSPVTSTRPTVTLPVASVL